MKSRVLPHLPLDATVAHRRPQGGDGARVETSDVNHPFAAGAFAQSNSTRVKLRNLSTVFLNRSKQWRERPTSLPNKFRTSCHLWPHHHHRWFAVLANCGRHESREENLVQDMMAGDAGLLPGAELVENSGFR